MCENTRIESEISIELVLPSDFWMESKSAESTACIAQGL